jgi:hypothetical protein
MASARPGWPLLLLLVLLSDGNAATVHVAPTGDDAAAGDATTPFATLMRAQRAVSPGDTVIIHGGLYRMDDTRIARRHRLWAYVIDLDRGGEPGRPIRYVAAAGEVPVFDFTAVKPAGLRVNAFNVTASWIELVGIDITGVQVVQAGHTQSICVENTGSHNRFERLRMYRGQAIGYYSTRGRDNLVLDCDAFENWDHTSDGGKGGNVDGFGCHPAKGSTGNVFRGCRAWFNSDDGYDCINAAEAVVFERCWAYGNGYSPGWESRADGNGFKAGGYGGTPVEGLPSPIPRHVVRHCLAVRNKAGGFYANHHPGGCDWFNNSAHRNGVDYSMLGRLPDNVTDVPGYGHVLRNNLSLGTRRVLSDIDEAGCTMSHNSFTLAPEPGHDEVESVDTAQMIMPRQPDGRLPDITLLRPKAGSRLIDAGIDVGLSFNGAAPDLGAAER